MEAAIGFEPMNEGFADLCLSHLATPPVFYKALNYKSGELWAGCLTGSLKSSGNTAVTPNSELRTLNRNNGAGGGTRTRDLNLGKVALYQLSYTRVKDHIAPLQALQI